ncbi:MAG: hypothetical protein A3F77_10210 [Betaproteobacteria bacterium RIFCSPLOWO2_12_FULL_67_28]|nr:MAG: hypothetical protein A3I65_03785 [Betaproteobacteria bacterium RIFCSPLOWO2_02_FULL_68_150]OGA61185.1 MAG: hypothetical protein A3F77_10210 [Betaproteobacteria bacterium RIFCSPLOWO2_12_FULL_67_28]
MKARVVPLGRGARWLAEGWRLFRVAPSNWLALVFVYWMVMTAVSLVPLLGVPVAMVLIPGFSVGFMAASRRSAQGRAPEMRSLFDGFRDRATVQLGLGAVYLLSLALLLGATALADDGVLARWMLLGSRPSDELLQSDGFHVALAIGAGLYLPVMMLFWFAPLLAAWHAMAAGQALFYSFFACLMNWRAFLGYSAAAAFVTLVIPFVVLGVLLLVSGGQLRVAAMTLVFPLLIILLPTLFASFYASYDDVFGVHDAD